MDWTIVRDIYYSSLPTYPVHPSRVLAGPLGKQLPTASNEPNNGYCIFVLVHVCYCSPK